MFGRMLAEVRYASRLQTYLVPLAHLRGFSVLRQTQHGDSRLAPRLAGLRPRIASP